MADQHLRHTVDTTFVAPKPFHCSSWETDGSNEPGSPLNGSMHASMSLSEESIKILSEASHNQLRWDRVMTQVLNLPEGYRKVSVLLIKWKAEEDQLKTKEEVDQLEEIFNVSFGYSTKIVDLSSKCGCKAICGCTPQTRLERAVSSFMRKHDHFDDLTIIYYTGHGTHLEGEGDHPGHLRLHASDDPNSPGLRWEDAENAFIHKARGDVLTIMDACFAGAVRNEIHRDSGRIYEYLAACDALKTTASPGEKSFTAALILSLKHLLVENQGRSFTTFDLLRVIENQEFRRTNPPELISRSVHDDRRILIAPIGHAKVKGEPYFDEAEIFAHLTLRIELKQKQLNAQEVEDLAKAISRAVRSSTVKTRRVDWLRLAPRKPSIRPTVKMFSFISSMMSKKKPLDTILEEPPKAPLRRPGLFASFGYMSSNMKPHFATFILLRPWSQIFVAGLLLALTTRLYFRKSAKWSWQYPLGVLRSLLHRSAG